MISPNLPYPFHEFPFQISVFFNWDEHLGRVVDLGRPLIHELPEESFPVRPPASAIHAASLDAPMSISLAEVFAGLTNVADLHKCRASGAQGLPGVSQG